MNTIARLVLTPGDPAGIGPDLCVMLARQQVAAEIIVVADRELLKERAAMLGIDVCIVDWKNSNHRETQRPGQINIIHVPLNEKAIAGQLNPANARYVLKTLDVAIDGCLDGTFDALITGPVHKGIINDAGIAFTGHTEYLAERTGCSIPVMMLATPGLRVALVTTHLPISKVAAEITSDRLTRVTSILNQDLQNHFGIESPCILVCGLNPHAGENGHLGREEIDTIIPVLNQLRDTGIHVEGPLPADTLFIPERLKLADAVLAMYHDQGLPVLKHMGFGKAVNVTLGLPIIRTSVDHGVALDLAGTGQASPGSLEYAIEVAAEMVAAKSNTKNIN
ncbi:4-hydroxythreonine-4-phosphate dehydrogenase PdxA [Kaarinaea lacus]